MTAKSAGSSPDDGDPFDDVPPSLRSRDQWLLWDASADTPRRPHWGGDFGISWSNPDDWHTFDDAVAAARTHDRWGIGYVMASGNDDYDDGAYACIDVDGAVDDGGDHRGWVPPLDLFTDAATYIERSPSGTGYHIPIEGGNVPEWWSDCQIDDHQGVDVLVNKFCTFTGDTIPESGSAIAPVDPTPFLYAAYENIRGEPPQLRERGGRHRRRYEGAEALTASDMEDALSHIDPDIPHPEWIRLAYAVHDFDSGDTGKRLFTEWSKRGTKWDTDAKRSIDAVWSYATQGGGVTVGTLIHKAKRNGWDAPTSPTPRPTPPDASDDGGRWDVLCPAEVVTRAGLGDDGDVSDLTDREKAKITWQLITETDRYHVRVRRDNGSLWACEEGVWKPTGERALRHAGRQAVGGANYGSNVVTELEAQARGDPTVEVGGDDFGLDPGYIAAENGVVDLATAVGNAGGDAVRPLRPDDHARTRLPVEYDPDADYDRWADYVDEWAEDGRADALQEYVGYCLHIGDMPIHRALLLVGSGANGKGVFLSVVRALLGEENTTSIELQTLANEQDAVADFEGSLANIDDDLSARKLGKGIGMFKKLVGGDRVRGRNLYEDAFEFQATGKHLYAANEVPDVNVPDDDEAFWRRWLLVEFPNHYPPSQRDPTLRGELTDPAVLSGVLNWAIEGWHRLREQGHFTNEDRYAHGKRERWQAWGESVDKFISECVDRDPDADRITTGGAYRRYVAWCREHEYDPTGQQTLTSKLKTEGVGYKPSIRINGRVQRGYDALGLTDDVPPSTKKPDELG